MSVMKPARRYRRVALAGATSDTQEYFMTALTRPAEDGSTPATSPSTPAIRATRAAHQLQSSYDRLTPDPTRGAGLADDVRRLRQARYHRLRRLAQEEGLSVHKVMTGQVVPDGFSSILDRSGRITPEPVDFHSVM